MNWMIILLLVGGSVSLCDATQYSYYHGGNIGRGLEAGSFDHFQLNGKPFVVFGGTFHYFRVRPEYWQDTLLKMRAAGINAVDLFVPWNYHELSRGKFDFHSPERDLGKLLRQIQAADMFAIVRLGPYVYAHWEFGGYPAWLLRDRSMQFRGNYAPHLEACRKYFHQVLSILGEHQFTRGGPIIAAQLEMEYFDPSIKHTPDYLQHLYNWTRSNGFGELLFVTETASVAPTLPAKNVLPNVLQAISLWPGVKVAPALEKMRTSGAKQCTVYISEYHTGSYDGWADNHHHMRPDINTYRKDLHEAMIVGRASFNQYMFRGGTNFGYMNAYHVTTSYDYEAPLTESGNYTAKYWATRDLWRQMVEHGIMPNLTLPQPPPMSYLAAYGVLDLLDVLEYKDILAHSSNKSIAKFDYIENISDQSYGYMAYRLTTTNNNNNNNNTTTNNNNNNTSSQQQFTVCQYVGTINDRADLIVDGQVKASTQLKATSIKIGDLTRASNYDLLVDNFGRSVHDLDHQHRGLNGSIDCHNSTVHPQVDYHLTVFRLDFENIAQLAQLDSWKKTWSSNESSPRLYRYNLFVDQRSKTIEDTYLYLPGWNRGNIFVNNFNLGRFNKAGPQVAYYLPASLLKRGNNSIILWEIYNQGQSVQSIDHPRWHG